MWQIRIQDPSGEIRVFPLAGTATLGRGENVTIPLRDPKVAMEAGILWQVAENSQIGPVQKKPSPYWLKVPTDSPPVYLGDLAVRDAHLPTGLPVVLGETQLTVEPLFADELPVIPVYPSGVRPWLTCSDSGRKILWIARKAAPTPLSIYLAGETGTGKEVMAQILHGWSDRASGPFVPLHCGALPLALAESELFGHVKGAFTGAVNQRPGALMQAHGGTLFLDEIGDLPLDIQVKLLRFLENGEIRPVGADRPVHADVRIVCATHQPLKQFVEEGKFRRDLFYRLASVTINLPPLRSRTEDIDMLATRFARDFGKSISPKALLRLQAHGWPGNVRELRHAVERASGLAGPFTPILNEESFEFLVTPENIVQTPALELGASVLTLDEMERVLLLKALKLAHGNRKNAAKILGVARSTLFEMLKRHKIQGPKSLVS